MLEARDVEDEDVVGRGVEAADRAEVAVAALAERAARVRDAEHRELRRGPSAVETAAVRPLARRAHRGAEPGVI